LHEELMADNPLYTIMQARSVVIAGASNNFMKMGSIQALNLLHGGFRGEVLFLHPTEKTVFDHPAYRTPAELPFVPEVALLTTPTRVTPGLLDGLGEHGVRHAVITTAGFREMGPEGARLEAELLEIAVRRGIRFVGPNCIGVLNATEGMNLTVVPYTDAPGHMGLISQSGTYVSQTMPYLRENGIRYSQAISVGNATSIDVVDCLDYLGDDPETAAIAMYIEGVQRGREFLAAATRVGRTKPLVALYVGGSSAGARSSQSHTGSLGSPDRLFDGVCAQAGILRASTVDEMFGWANALANMPLPRGRRMAILTHSGGPATSMADACERWGLEVPEFSPALQTRIRAFLEPTASAKNPVDLTFVMGQESFVDKIPEVLFASDEIDGVLVHGMMDTGFALEMHKVAGHMLGISREDFIKPMEFDLTHLLELPARYGKPLVASNFIREDHAAQTFRERGVPLFRTPEAAVKAMAALARAGEFRKRWPASD
jgi:acetyltransferase